MLFTSGLTSLIITLVRKAEHVFYALCMFEAFTTMIEAVLFCIVVEIFPEQVR